jgi:hypothetical protein
MTQIKGPSKKELDETKTDFSLIVPEEYLVEVSEIEEKTQPKYKKPTETEEVLNVRFKIIETREGEEPRDEDGNDATGRLLFFTANVESLGFQTDGTPSKARQFLWYIIGADIEDEIVIEDTNKLIGKRIYADVIKKENQKGEMTNRIVRFIKIKKSKLEQVKKEIPVVEDDDDEISVSEIPF